MNNTPETIPIKERTLAFTFNNSSLDYYLCPDLFFKLGNGKMMNFSEYQSAFSYKGKAIYKVLFELHGHHIKTKKEKFAINNLEKIIKATFKVSSKIGFHEMSLRDLCRETGLSMGGIYSCIGSKDIIAIMIKEMVKQVSFEIIENAKAEEDKQLALKKLVTNFIYATEILQPWFYFLYFETRSLPAKEQQDSKKIEIRIIAMMEDLLNQTNVDAAQSHFIATLFLAIIQERYLKPWKYKNADSSIDDYVQQALGVTFSNINP